MTVAATNARDDLLARIQRKRQQVEVFVGGALPQEAAAPERHNFWRHAGGRVHGRTRSWRGVVHCVADRHVRIDVAFVAAALRRRCRLLGGRDRLHAAAEVSEHRGARRAGAKLSCEARGAGGRTDDGPPRHEPGDLRVHSVRRGSVVSRRAITGHGGVETQRCSCPAFAFAKHR